MDTMRLVIAEPDLEFRRAVVQAVHESGSVRDVQIAEVLSLMEMMNVLRAGDSSFDLAVYGLDSPELDGVAGISALKARFPLVSHVVYSASNSLLVPRQAFAAGAAGFFRRDCPLHGIVQVIDLVLGAEAFAIPDHLRTTLAIA